MAANLKDTQNESNRKCLLIGLWWTQRGLEDTTTYINRQLANSLVKQEFDVYYTVLSATDDEKAEASGANITLILPEETRLNKKDSIDMLHDHEKYYSEMKMKCKGVSIVIGHVNMATQNTGDIAVNVVETLFQEANLIIFIHRMPTTKELSETEIGNDEIMSYASRVSLFVTVGPNLTSYMKAEIRGFDIEDGCELIKSFFPEPVDRYSKLRISTPAEDSDINILSFGEFNTESDLQKYADVEKAFSQMIENSQLPRGKTRWQVYSDEADSNLVKTLLSKSERGVKFRTLKISKPPDEVAVRQAFMKCSLFLSIQNKALSVAVLNGLAAGVPIILDGESEIGRFVEDDSKLDIFHENLTVSFPNKDRSDEFKKKTHRYLRKRSVTFKRAKLLKQYMEESCSDGSMNETREAFYGWCSTQGVKTPKLA